MSDRRGGGAGPPVWRPPYRVPSASSSREGGGYWESRGGYTYGRSTGWVPRGGGGGPFARGAGGYPPQQHLPWDASMQRSQSRTPVQGIGYMRPPKVYGSHKEQYEIPDMSHPERYELLDLQNPPSDDEQPPVRNAKRSRTPPQQRNQPPQLVANVPDTPNVDDLPVFTMTGDSPAPERPPAAPRGLSAMQAAGVQLVPSMVREGSTVLPPTEEQTNEEKLKRIRRRDFNVTYWGDSMVEVVRRMANDFKDQVAYCIFQREVAPSTGRPHWQIYLEFFQPHDISWVKRQLFCDTTTHVEIRLRSREDCRNYCKKEKTRMLGPQEEVGPFEFGTWREQGKSQKMQQIREAIVDGRNLDEIAEEDPHMVFQHRASLQWYQDQVQMRRAMNDTRDVTVRLFIGPTNSGKTHLAVQEALYYTDGNMDQVYILDSSGRSKDTLWFDGYQYGKVLIIDDYDSWIQVAFLLRLLDKYPCRLPVKGGNKWAKYTEVWITSNKDLKQWTEAGGEPIHPKHLEALYRRIKWILWIPERGKFSIVKQPHEPYNMELPTVEPKPVEAPPPPAIDNSTDAYDDRQRTVSPGAVAPPPSLASAEGGGVKEEGGGNTE